MQIEKRCVPFCWDSFTGRNFAATVLPPSVPARPQLRRHRSGHRSRNHARIRRSGSPVRHQWQSEAMVARRSHPAVPDPEAVHHRWDPSVTRSGCFLGYHQNDALPYKERTQGVSRWNIMKINSLYPDKAQQNIRRIFWWNLRKYPDNILINLLNLDRAIQQLHHAGRWYGRQRHQHSRREHRWQWRHSSGL